MSPVSTLWKSTSPVSANCIGASQLQGVANSSAIAEERRGLTNSPFRSHVTPVGIQTQSPHPIMSGAVSVFKGGGLPARPWWKSVLLELTQGAAALSHLLRSPAAAGLASATRVPVTARKHSPITQPLWRRKVSFVLSDLVRDRQTRERKTKGKRQERSWRGAPLLSPFLGPLGSAPQTNWGLFPPSPRPGLRSATEALGRETNFFFSVEAVARCLFSTKASTPCAHRVLQGRRNVQRLCACSTVDRHRWRRNRTFCFMFSAPIPF